MLEAIIGIGLTLLGAKFGSTWWFPFAKRAASAVVKDPKNPVNDLRTALEQEIIARYSKQIDAAVAELEKMQAQAKIDEASALERGRAIGDGMDITVVQPDPKPEDFKPVFVDKDPPK